MDIKYLELIDGKLLEIRKVIKTDDGFHVCELIINNLGDELLKDVVNDMLVKMGHKKEIIRKINKIVNEINIKN